ncbi:hypothetical protein FB567DRAFT_554621 [Paraphoma chrysanthemicola]|uniref:Uncharacterized protein n=1 Tax=Paraphoma chrysanthemicola TaxID=798071 RepID=A0A8K0QVF6_9PLEO|nr:hypothetical protein FB567DRAFT_554621 [Paraphoma chrysanthemicola]
MDSENAVLHGGRVGDRDVVASSPAASTQEHLGIPENRHAAPFAYDTSVLVDCDGQTATRLAAPSSVARNVTYCAQGVMKYPLAAGQSGAGSRQYGKEEEASDTEIGLYHPRIAHALPMYTSDTDDTNGGRHGQDIIEYSPSGGDAQTTEDSDEAGAHDSSSTNAGGEHVRIQSQDINHPDHAFESDDEEWVEVEASDDRPSGDAFQKANDETLHSPGGPKRRGQSSETLRRTYAPFTSADPVDTANARPDHEDPIRLVRIELEELQTTLAAAERRVVLLEQSNRTAVQRIQALENLVHRTLTDHMQMTETLCSDVAQLRDDMMTAHEALRILQRTKEHTDFQHSQQMAGEERRTGRKEGFEVRIGTRLGAEKMAELFTMAEEEARTMFKQELDARIKQELDSKIKQELDSKIKQELDAKIKQTPELLPGHSVEDQAEIHMEEKMRPFEDISFQVDLFDFPWLDYNPAGGDQTANQILTETSSSHSLGDVLNMHPEQQSILAKHLEPRDHDEDLYSDPAVLETPDTQLTYAVRDKGPEEQPELASALVDSAYLNSNPVCDLTCASAEPESRGLCRHHSEREQQSLTKSGIAKERALRGIRKKSQQVDHSETRMLKLEQGVV